ncbi:hypothetical protein PR048_014705 [Dryococelus australis]|uniref:Uncharacterized protein n=1 Tax=Dryococelus australis TaxID=614101 RepID=A0ABQ9HEY6_9NEOP|nr:hypothetical protein PR048_014705 [Dryococelus australis]
MPQVLEKYTSSYTCILAYFTCNSDSTSDVTSGDRYCKRVHCRTIRHIVSEKIWAALNIGVLRADEGEAREVWSHAGMLGRGKQEITEKMADQRHRPPAQLDEEHCTLARAGDEHLHAKTRLEEVKEATGIAERRMEGARVCEAELVAISSHQTALGRARSAARLSSVRLSAWKSPDVRHHEGGEAVNGFATSLFAFHCPMPKYLSTGTEGGGNGRSPRKCADQRHRPERFPYPKIRESNPLCLSLKASSLTTKPPLPRQLLVGVVFLSPAYLVTRLWRPGMGEGIPSPLLLDRPSSNVVKPSARREPREKSPKGLPLPLPRLGRVTSLDPLFCQQAETHGTGDVATPTHATLSLPTFPLPSYARLHHSGLFDPGSAHLAVAPVRSAHRTKINLNLALKCAFWRFRIMISDQWYGGNTARLVLRSDEGLDVRVRVDRIAPSFLDLGSGISPSTSVSDARGHAQSTDLEPTAFTAARSYVICCGYRVDTQRRNGETFPSTWAYRRFSVKRALLKALLKSTCVHIDSTNERLAQSHRTESKGKIGAHCCRSQQTNDIDSNMCSSGVYSMDAGRMSLRAPVKIYAGRSSDLFSKVDFKSAHFNVNKFYSVVRSLRRTVGDFLQNHHVFPLPRPPEAAYYVVAVFVVLRVQTTQKRRRKATGPEKKKKKTLLPRASRATGRDKEQDDVGRRLRGRRRKKEGGGKPVPADRPASSWRTAGESASRSTTSPYRYPRFPPGNARRSRPVAHARVGSLHALRCTGWSSRTLLTTPRPCRNSLFRKFVMWQRPLGPIARPVVENTFSSTCAAILRVFKGRFTIANAGLVVQFLR